MLNRSKSVYIRSHNISIFHYRSRCLAKMYHAGIDFCLTFRERAGQG